MKDILIIGDSQTPSVVSNTARGYMIPGLNKGGWTVNNLTNALTDYKKKNLKPKTPQAICICIGTNGAFGSNSVGKTDKVNALVTAIKDIFGKSVPLYVIKGSWGWFKHIDDIESVCAYYYRDRFAFTNNVKVIEPAIGYSKTHPDRRTPSIRTIANVVDTIGKI